MRECAAGARRRLHSGCRTTQRRVSYVQYRCDSVSPSPLRPPETGRRAAPGQAPDRPRTAPGQPPTHDIPRAGRGWPCALPTPCGLRDAVYGKLERGTAALHVQPPPRRRAVPAPHPWGNRVGALARHGGRSASFVLLQSVVGAQVLLGPPSGCGRSPLALDGPLCLRPQRPSPARLQWPAARRLSASAARLRRKRRRTRPVRGVGGHSL
jgi:hypothetical protein